MRAETITIPAGAEGIDFAWWRPGDQVRPWSFVVRYLCKLPNGKAVTRAEIDFYHSLGVAVGLVWEQAANDWEKGAAKGTEHGRLAAAFAQRLGYPKGLPLLTAFDTNALPGDARAQGYGNAFYDEVMAAGYDAGPYADLDVIRVLAKRSGLNWLAGATSWSDPTKPYRPETMPGYELVHVRQVISGSTPSYDRNVALRPFLAWLPHETRDEPTTEVELRPIPPRPPVPTTPIEEDDDMPNRFVADSQTKGSAVVTLTVDLEGRPHYTMVGFDDAQTRAAYAVALPVKSFTDTEYLALAAVSAK